MTPSNALLTRVRDLLAAADEFSFEDDGGTKLLPITGEYVHRLDLTHDELSIDQFTLIGGGIDFTGGNVWSVNEPDTNNPMFFIIADNPDPSQSTGVGDAVTIFGWAYVDVSLAVLIGTIREETPIVISADSQSPVLPRVGVTIRPEAFR